MMDEMQKTLARRRAKVDRSSEEPDSDRQDGDSGRRQELEKSSSPGKPFSHPGSQAGSESPKPGRRGGSTRGSLCGETEMGGPAEQLSNSLGQWCLVLADIEYKPFHRD